MSGWQCVTLRSAADEWTRYIAGKIGGNWNSADRKVCLVNLQIYCESPTSLQELCAALLGQNTRQAILDILNTSDSEKIIIAIVQTMLTHGSLDLRGLFGPISSVW
jgi:hypothetical protein